MSGLCGIVEPSRLFNQNDVASMVAGLAVRESEGREAVCERSFALGVSKAFAGQSVGGGSGIWVAVDADLLNLKELRAKVQAQGQPTPANTAELLASLYSLHGLEFVNDLEGAFAFALWDERKNRLLLAIDRLGIKNIYWRRHDNYFAFATRISALRALDPSLELKQSALAQFLLFSAIPAPLTIYAGIEKIEPGFTLIFENNQIKKRRYWDLQFEEERRSEAEWAEMVRAELRASVHRHVRGLDAESAGAFLSGGTDSSSVVAFMSELHRPVRTFSAVFNESSYSEESFVRTVASRFGTEQHDCRLSPEDALAAIPRIARYYEEPFGNSSAIAAFFCGIAARQCGVDTLLGGDGGDELFAGNQRYETDKYFALYHRLPSMLRKGLIEPLTRALPRDHKWLSLPRRYVQRALIPNPQRFFSYNFLLSFPAEELFASEFLAQAPREQWLQVPESHFARPTGASELNRLLYLDCKMVLADNDLKKVSGMAELAGVQVRYPLLDHRLAELAGRVPTKLKLRRFEKRYIFKKAMSGILPDYVLYKKKHGMGVPVSSWLLHDPRLHSFVQDVLHDSRTRQRGYFRPGLVERLLDLQRTEHVAYYGEIVWYLLVLELWHREHFDHAARLVCAG
jgi:asparagine synthase (glutamine-hydrolysing)